MRANYTPARSAAVKSVDNPLVNCRDMGQFPKELMLFVPRCFAKDYEDGADEYLIDNAMLQQRKVQISVIEPVIKYIEPGDVENPEFHRTDAEGRVIKPTVGAVKDVEFKLSVYGIMLNGELQPLGQNTPREGYRLEGYKSQILSTRKLVKAGVLPSEAKSQMVAYAYMWENMGNQAYVKDQINPETNLTFAKSRVYISHAPGAVSGLRFEYEIRPVPDSDQLSLGIIVTGGDNLQLLGVGIGREASGVERGLTVKRSGQKRTLSVNYDQAPPARQARQPIGAAQGQFGDYGDF